MRVGMAPRKFIGVAGLWHADQPSIIDHAWEQHIYSRSPVALTIVTARGRLTL